MKLVDISHPALLEKAQRVTKIDANIKKILSGMKRVLQRADIGIGLAAPQVGVSYQIFLVSPNMPDATDKKNEPIDVYINPKIIARSNPIHSKGKKTLEGCLSIPEVWGPVARSKKITLQYEDENGKKHTKKFEGYIATIIQHEVDHLEGTLFTHRVMEQGENLYKTEGDDLIPLKL